MEKRKLGKTGFEVVPLALGGNVFGWTRRRLIRNVELLKIARRAAFRSALLGPALSIITGSRAAASSCRSPA
jgi:hypothetical protein